MCILNNFATVLGLPALVESLRALNVPLICANVTPRRTNWRRSRVPDYGDRYPGSASLASWSRDYPSSRRERESEGCPLPQSFF